MLGAGSFSMWRIGLAITALKLLLVPTYHSTDFEVHRNWLAITSSLPLSQWYTEETSEWTLDYPPLFAWFERLLTYPAALFDPAMLEVSKELYESPECILFQRLSVIATDAVLLGAVWFATRKQRSSEKHAVRILVAANAGLLLVDHIHFQYNGLLLGILLWSIALIQEGRDVAAALCFAVLLNMKHLFAALAPLYLVYLLRHYCRGPAALQRFLTLGVTTTAVFAISFGPFVAAGQLQQILGRLFPFQRGLLHAYWAPNVWALYAFADKGLSIVTAKLGMPVRSAQASMTGGLVQVEHFSVLPDVGPGTAAAAVLASMAPLLASVWKRPDPARFARCAALASLNSFMLGYHVHEKAILLVVLPLTLDAAQSMQCARVFTRLSTIGHFSLLPLMFNPNHYLLKMLTFLMCLLASCLLLENVFTGGNSEGRQKRDLRLEGEAMRGAQEQAGLLGQSGHGAGPEIAAMTKVDCLGLGMMALLELYCTVMHTHLLPDLAFLPLMLTSVVCAVGLLWVWASLWMLACWQSSPQKDD